MHHISHGAVVHNCYGYMNPGNEDQALRIHLELPMVSWKNERHETFVCHRNTKDDSYSCEYGEKTTLKDKTTNIKQLVGNEN